MSRIPVASKPFAANSCSAASSMRCLVESLTGSGVTATRATGCRRGMTLHCVKLSIDRTRPSLPRDVWRSRPRARPWPCGVWRLVPILRCGIGEAAVVSRLMISSDVRIARLTRRAAWHAIEDGKVIGEANAMLRPDRRWFVSVDTWFAGQFLPLVSAVADDLRHDLHTTVDEDDEKELRNWQAAGFTVLRREHHYVVPTD